MGTRPQISRRARRFTLLATAVLVSGLGAATATGHIERASYWPDPGVDSAGGQPAGGAVPEAKSLLNAAAAPEGATHVVCPGGRSSVPASLQQQSAPGGSTTKASQKKKKKKIKALRRKIRKAKRKGNKKKVAALRKKLAGLLAAGKVASTDAPLLSHPSIQALQASIADAQANGYKVRPSDAPIPLSAAEGQALLDANVALLKRCGFDSIQAAVNFAGNNDRVVVLPGLYTEPESRAAPTNDPRCDQYEEVNDRPGDGEGGFQTGANTYAYVFNCPNDQNLVAILGRAPNHAALPPTPRDDRHGIPDEGACIRCNLQLEGSGVKPDDVIVDAGRVESGNGGPADPAKDVGIRADRADGFVLRNLNVRHVREHGIYVHEVDGYRLERFKTFHAEEYGVLTFTSDHGLIQDCETYGSGDAGIYPGSAPDTGEQTVEASERYNTEIRRCDMHHNTAGYSGTAANAVWIHHNDFYDNALGFTTDVFTAAGHPGFPQDSDLIEDNEFYSNNFNPYVDQPDDDEVIPTIPVPVGTALWIAGGNNNTFRNNRVWDNWRRGVMLFSVPDAFVCGDSPVAGGNQQHGCNELEINTSYRNRFHDNVMGQTPSSAPDPNGVDFWWDQFPTNTNNCWFDNVGQDGTRESLNTVPPINPVAPGLSLPLLFLPEDCATSIGLSGVPQEVELLSCLAAFEEGAPTPCTWFERPPEPQP